MNRAFLGLGSNQGDRLEILREGLRRLTAAGDIRLVAASRLYEAEPWEREPGRPEDRAGWFLNCVVAIETSLPPRALLDRVVEIEAAFGRSRDPSQTPEARRFAPRTLDIDILLYADEVISASDDLQIPHLLMHERAFVLRPLAELAPEVTHPTLYRTIRELVEDLEDTHEVSVAALPREWIER